MNYHTFTDPTSLSSLQVWYAADCIGYSSGCTTPANGTNITTWHDKSGNSNTATVIAGTCTFNTNQVNSLPAVTFASCKMSLASNVAASDGHAAFAVFKLTSTAAKSMLFSGAIDSFGYWFNDHSTSGKMQGLDKTNRVEVGYGTAIADTNWHQANCLYKNIAAGAILQFRLGEAFDASTLASAQNLTGVDSGLGYNVANGGETFAGELAEFIFYSRTLPNDEIQLVEGYLYQKYAL